MNVVVTVDTEEDNQWQRPWPSTVENLQFLPRFQFLCDRYGLKATYLCTYGVVNSPAFDLIRSYQKNGRAEIGAHLHPWANPPFNSDWSEDRACCPYPSELPLDLFSDKLEALTEATCRRTGIRPRSYRAGRWGFCAEHVPALLRLGYEVDSSVTPSVSWQSHLGTRQGGPDFRQAPVHPYFLSPENTCQPGASDLLEVPVTVLTNSLAHRSAFLKRLLSTHQGTLTTRIISKCLRLRPRWFRPLPGESARDLKRVHREACRQHLPVTVFMCHSSELMPGGSPYYPTPESVERLYGNLESLFGFLAESGAKGLTLHEFSRQYGSQPRGTAQSRTAAPV